MTFFFLSEDEYVQHLPPSLSVSLFPSRLQPISLCLSLCLSQPITGWLQVLNPGPHHQLAHYITALNLCLVPSGSLFLSLPLCCFLSVPSLFPDLISLLCISTFRCLLALLSLAVSLFVCSDISLLFLFSFSPHKWASHPRHPSWSPHSSASISSLPFSGPLILQIATTQLSLPCL